jgi:hypothetical protein
MEQIVFRLRILAKDVSGGEIFSIRTIGLLLASISLHVEVLCFVLIRGRVSPACRDGCVVLRPGQIKISTVAHSVGSLDKRLRQIRVFPTGMDFSCAAFEHFRILMDQAGNLSKEFIDDVVFSFHLSIPFTVRQQKTP